MSMNSSTTSSALAASSSHHECLPFWADQSRAVMATMHRKEQVIAPLFRQHLGLHLVVPTNFDTDALGTFTRDIPRAGSQIEAARQKAKQALALTGETIAVASEGAFFPHPVFPGIACNREIVLLLDMEHNIEVVGSELSNHTNFAHRSVHSVEAAIAFAEQVGFPNHALVAMPSRDGCDRSQIYKGIQTSTQLCQVVERLLQQSHDGSIHLETDMRAMFNPTRMQVIEQATQNLIAKIQSTCPNCDYPGFDVVEQKRGLPCQWCHLPTQLIKAETYRCQHCRFQEDRLFPQGIEFADPGQCSHCNP